MATITPSVAGGNWSDVNAWTGLAIPTAADDVVFHAGAGNITIDGTSGSPSLCRSLDCATFSYAGTLTQASGKVLNIGDASGGALKLVAGMTYAPNIGSTINFVSTTGTNNITTAGKAMGPLVFNGAGGTWQFQDGYTNSTFGTSITLTLGTLDMNGKTFTLSKLVDSGTGTRALTLGAATINIGANWTLNATGLTLSAASATVATTTTGVVFQGAGGSYGTFTTNSSATIQDSNTFGTFTFNNFSGSAGTLTLGGDITVSGTFTSNGVSLSQASRNTIISNSRGAPRTISAATVTCIYTNFRDITGAGAGNWDLHAITGLSGDCGGNSGITFTSPITCFMKTAVSVNYSASANWFTTSGGSTPARTPLPQDTARFDINSVTAGSKTITIDMPHIAGMDWTGIANTPALASGSSAWDCYGSITLVSGMTHTGTGALTLDGRGSFNFDGGGLTWPTSSTITVNAPTGTYTFTTAFASSSSYTQTQGSTTTRSTFGVTSLTVTAGTFTVGGNVTLTGALSVTGTMTDGTGTTYTISGGTTLAVPSGGSLTIGTFSGTSSSTLIIGTAVIGTLTLSGAFSLISTGSLTVGAGGMTCTTFAANAAAGTCAFTSGSGLVSCSSTCAIGGNGTNSITFGSGGLTCTTLTESSGATHPTINYGSGTITVTSTGTVFTGVTNVTRGATTATLSVTDTSATTKTVSMGAVNYSGLNISISGAASNGTVTFSGAFTAATMTFGADASIIWTKTTTYTFTSLVCNGSSGHVVTFATNTGGSAATLSCANPVNVNWMSIKDSTASGSTPFYAGGNSTSVSGNTNWTSTFRPITGTIAITEAKDVMSASGGETFTGTMSITEGLDTLSASGKETFTGSIAITENLDLMAATGNQATGTTGTIAITENVDTVIASGLETITGTIAIVENVDAMAASGKETFTGSISIIETKDTIVASGLEIMTGTIAIIEALDVMSASATETLIGSIAITESKDLISASGLETILGSISIIENLDTMISVGVGSPTGNLTIIESQDLIAASGKETFTSNMAVTELPDLVAASATITQPIIGSLHFTQSPDHMAAIANYNRWIRRTNLDATSYRKSRFIGGRHKTQQLQATSNRRSNMDSTSRRKSKMAAGSHRNTLFKGNN